MIIDVRTSAATAWAFAHALGCPSMVPCRGKSPAVRGFDKYSRVGQSTGELRSFLGWSASPMDFRPDAFAMWQGPVVSGPSPRLVVLDIDSRDEEIAAGLLAEYGTSPLTVRTPGKGTHHYFVEPERVAVATTLFKALSHDVKGRDSLCHLPGSAHPSALGTYEAFFEGEPLALADLLSADGRPTLPRGALLGALPTFNIEAFERSKAHCFVPHETEYGDSVFILDDDTARVTAERYQAACPGAVTGDEGDPFTNRMANKLGDLGVPEHIALEVMAGEWNDRCSPPWTHDELAYKVRSAYRTRKRPIGCRARGAQWDEAADGDERELMPIEEISEHLHALAADLSGG